MSAHTRTDSHVDRSAPHVMLRVLETVQAYADKGLTSLYPWQAAALEEGIDGSNLVREAKWALIRCPASPTHHHARMTLSCLGLSGGLCCAAQGDTRSPLPPVPEFYRMARPLGSISHCHWQLCRPSEPASQPMHHSLPRLRPPTLLACAEASGR